MFLAIGCASPITRDAVMSNPDISAAYHQISQAEAMAVVQHQMENTVKSPWWIKGCTTSGDVDTFSVNTSGIVIHSHDLIDPRPAPGYGYRYVKPETIPIYKKPTTIAFSDIKRIGKSGGRFYVLYNDQEWLCAFDSFNMDSMEKKKFLASLFLLCPNAH